METLQQHAVGVRIQVTIIEDGSPVDISTVTTKEIVFLKPGGRSQSKTASFVNSGTDGKLEYVTESGFLNTSGDWQAQGYIVFPGGFDGRSDIVRFQVAKNL